MGWRSRFDPRWAAVASATVGVLTVALSAEFVDFRTLRVPILMAVGVCVLWTAIVWIGPRRPIDGGRPDEGGHVGPPLRGRSASAVEFLRSTALGAGIWGAGGAVYAIVHVARGETFDADRFGPQWAQALGLIGVHALFLGVPTGIATALVLYVVRRMRQERERPAPRTEPA